MKFRIEYRQAQSVVHYRTVEVEADDDGADWWSHCTCCGTWFTLDGRIENG